MLSTIGGLGVVLTTGDINNDGYVDIVSQLGLSSGATYLGNGQGSFNRKESFSTLIGQASASLIDYNQDGHLDLMLATDQSNIQFLTAVTEEASSLVNLETQDQASRSLSLLDSALNNLLSAGAEIGALQNRLNFAENVTSLTIESLSSARSQLIDADFAAETAELTKQQILTQSAAAVLGQANAQLQTVLGLLRV